MKMIPRWMGSMSKLRRQRHDQRHDDHDGREDVHQAADDEQEHVQAQQEHRRRMDVALGPLEQPGRHLRVDQVAGEADGHRQDEQHAADQRTHSLEHPEQVAARRQVAVDEATATTSA